MPRVGILCFEDTYLSCAAGFADVLGVGNVHLREVRTQAAPFEWVFLSETGGKVAANGGLAIGTEPATQAGALDVVLIPAIHYPGYKRVARVLDDREKTYDWLRSLWRRGSWIGANCTGTFLLAQSGLLDGRRATTHWRYADRLQARHPAVLVDADTLYAGDDRVFTSAGSAAGIDLLLHLVRLDFGPDAANSVARRLVVASHRSGGQAQFIERPVLASPNSPLQSLLDRDRIVTNPQTRHIDQLFNVFLGV